MRATVGASAGLVPAEFGPRPHFFQVTCTGETYLNLILLLFYALELYPSQQKSSRLGQSAPVSVPHLPTRVTKLL